MTVRNLVWFALAALLGPTAAVAPVPAASAASAALVLLWRKVRPLVWFGLVLVFVGSALRGALSLSAFEARRIGARDALGPPRRCSFPAIVKSSPVLVGGSWQFLVLGTELDCEGRRLAGPFSIRVYADASSGSLAGASAAGAARGDVLELVAELGPVGLFRNLDLPDPTPLAALRGALFSGKVLSAERKAQGSGPRRWIDRARAHARERIQATFAPGAAAMARALVLGESDLLSADDRAFKASGLAHLLAVSGTHLVFAVVALVRALTALLVRVEHLAARFDVTRGAAAVGALAALVYADYAGGTGSAWRAAWMLAVVFGVRALGRRVAPGRALALSVVIGAALEPLCAFDVSFMLSAAATLGLLWAGSPLSLRLAPCRPAPLRWLSQSLVVTVCAMLACAPLLAVFSPGLTAAGAFANVLAAPLGEVVALPLCLGHALLGGAPALERGAALVASGALLLVKKLAHLSAGVRVLAFHLPVPSPWHWVLIATGAIGVASVPPARARAFRMAWLAATFAGLFLLECAQDRARAPTGRLRVTVLDVGQGDSLLVDFPDGRAMLIDGGGVVGTDVDPGKLVILPLLRGRRRARIDVVVLTHPHPDHFLGLVSVADAIPIGEFWDSGQGEEEGAGVTYAGLVRTLRMRGVPVRRPGALCDRPRSFGGATVEVLAPCPNFVARRPPNDNSFVLRIRYRERVALLMGDAEALEEGELVERLGGSLRADFLKVGHHGSRTSSTPSFIREVDPWLSVISCGVRNRFGHPHAQTLELLGHRSVGMARTDRFGSVMWQTDGRSLEARAFSMFH